jgi:hypothetical protein
MFCPENTDLIGMVLVGKGYALMLLGGQSEALQLFLRAKQLASGPAQLAVAEQLIDIAKSGGSPCSLQAQTEACLFADKAPPSSRCCLYELSYEGVC